MSADLQAESSKSSVTLDTPALRALADPQRARIVELLAGEQLCVCHLTDELDLAQPVVSHHLKVLRDAGLVEGDRFRYWTYYRLVPGALEVLGRELTRTASHAPTGERRRRACC
jgi:ArsR family transcriptional regulator